MRNAGRLTFAAIAISVGLGSPTLLAQDATGGGALVVHAGSLPKTSEWGTGGVTSYTIGAAELLPKDSISGYGTHVSPSERYATSSGAVFQATPYIPAARS